MQVKTNKLYIDVVNKRKNVITVGRLLRATLCITTAFLAEEMLIIYISGSQNLYLTFLENSRRFMSCLCVYRPPRSVNRLMKCAINTCHWSLSQPNEKLYLQLKIYKHGDGAKRFGYNT
jgi:hypothetical protein